ncbi:hypothetical protein EV286_108235 [Rhizobium sp. BK251]|nr:hypothetical protein EV286_108235 [Rhizobium sp. BK251]
MNNLAHQPSTPTSPVGPLFEITTGHASHSMSPGYILTSGGLPIGTALRARA